MQQKNYSSNMDVAVQRFILDFEAHSFVSNAEFGDGERMIELLSDGKNVCEGSKFEKNFKLNFHEFISDELKNNKSFNRTVRILTNNKGKGVGAGELVFPLLVSGWTLHKKSKESEGDGMLNGFLREVKNGLGAGLKPIKKGLLVQGIVDILNKKYFNGMVLGKREHKEIIEKYGDFTNAVYKSYFSELWPTADIDSLISSLNGVGDDVKKFNYVVGRFILKEYQRIDGWKSIVFIHPETLDVVNISDVNSNDCFEHLSFNVRLSRGKDTQGISDGYVVVKMVQPKKPRKSKKIDNTVKIS